MCRQTAIGIAMDVQLVARTVGEDNQCTAVEDNHPRKEAEETQGVMCLHCSSCGVAGHWAKDCPKRAQGTVPSALKGSDPMSLEKRPPL